MCGFCELHTEGIESCRDYISVWIGLGKMEKAMAITIWFNEREGGKSYSFDVDLTTSSGDEIASLSMPIQYCPVCGRNLIEKG